MIERILSVGVGAVLIAAVCYLMARPRRSAQIIQDYYARQVERETAPGWLGKPLLAPGPRGALIMLLLIVGAMLVIGAGGIYVGVSG